MLNDGGNCLPFVVSLAVCVARLARTIGHGDACYVSEWAFLSGKIMRALVYTFQLNTVPG